MAGLAVAALTLYSVPANAAPDVTDRSRPSAKPGRTVAQTAAEGGITPEQTNRMVKEAPLVKAALRIQQAAGTASGFAGVALRDDTVAVYWKGDVPPSIRTRLSQEARTLPVRVWPAAYSSAELARAVDRLTEAVRRSGNRSITSIGYDVTGSGVRVQTVETGPGTASLPDVGVAVRFERGRSAPKAGDDPTPPAGPASVAERPGRARSTASANLAPPAPGRHDDMTPAWGGAHLINPHATGGNGGWTVRNPNTQEVVDADDFYHCTSGFPALLGNNQVMITPISCGSSFTPFVQPTGDRVNIPVESMDWSNYATGVAAILSDGGAEPYIYGGDSWNQWGWRISAWEAPVAGQHVCVSGAQTGQICDVEITDFVGDLVVWTPNSSGGSFETSGVTQLHVTYDSGPVRADRKPYTLADGGSCNSSPALLTQDIAGCSHTLNVGDIGAAVFTLPADYNVGVTIKGLLVSLPSPEVGSTYFGMSGVENVLRHLPVQPLVAP